MNNFEHEPEQTPEYIEPLSGITPEEQALIDEWAVFAEIRMSKDDLLKLDKINEKRSKLESVSRATDFEELFNTLRRVGPIQGSEKIFLPEELIEIIEGVRRGNKDINFVTRAVSLREVVLRILAGEVLNNKTPDSPEGFPPGSQLISETNWLYVSEGCPSNVARINFLKSYSAGSNWSAGGHWDYPQIGTQGHATQYGVINGTLIWCDGVFAIFDTPEGKIKVPFKELMAPEGKTYAEREETLKKENEERQRRNQATPLKERRF